MPPETLIRTKTLTGTSALTAWLGPKRVLMRTRYDKGRHPTTVVMDEWKKRPIAADDSEAEGAAHQRVPLSGCRLRDRPPTRGPDRS